MVQALPPEFRFRAESPTAKANPFGGDQVLSSAKDTDPCTCLMGSDTAVISSPKDTDPCACLMGSDTAVVSSPKDTDPCACLMGSDTAV
ncbi:MAG: hypothetical protein HY319_14995, partial [Armatimonadetes bacterium]|nr:hypothetical protein [Armatimonadota bacterium]